MRTVLLVDDDDAVALTLGALLEDEGVEVLRAKSLGQARQRLGDARQVSAVLLDHRLGDGEGVELLPDLRARFPEARVVLLSGAPPDAMPASVDALVPKGVSFGRVWSALFP